MSLSYYLGQSFAQHALLAAGLVAITSGLIGPFVVTRGAAFAVHGTAELAFTGAAAGLLVANNPDRWCAHRLAWSSPPPSACWADARANVTR